MRLLACLNINPFALFPECVILVIRATPPNGQSRLVTASGTIRIATSQIVNDPRHNTQEYEPIFIWKIHRSYNMQPHPADEVRHSCRDDENGVFTAGATVRMPPN